MILGIKFKIANTLNANRSTNITESAHGSSNTAVHQNTNSLAKIATSKNKNPFPSVKDATKNAGAAIKNDPYCILTIETVFGDSPFIIPETLDFASNVLGCMYHRYVTTIQEMCVEPKSFGAFDNGGGFVCVDNNLLRKDNCRVILFGAVANGLYMTHMENQYGCSIESYSGGKKFDLHSHVGRWILNQKNNDGDIDLLVLKVTTSSQDVEAVNDIILKESLVSRIKQISIKIHLNPENALDESYKGRLKLFRNLYTTGFRIFFYERDWNCPIPSSIKYRFLSCYSVFFMRKQKAKAQDVTIPPDAKLKSMNAVDILRVYDRFLSSLHLMCQENLRFGKIKDGGWNVCHDRKYRPKPPCLIYSFGINNDWSFDDQVSKTYGCNVYSFDPSMGKPNHKHSDKVWFYNIGIGGRNYNNKQNWKLMTLDSISNMLNHTENIIDIVKMDVEKGEWEIIPQLISSGILKRVRQLYFEFHSAQSAERLSIIRQLYEIGFRVFWTHKNPISVSDCKELKDVFVMPLDGWITSEGLDILFPECTVIINLFCCCVLLLNKKGVLIYYVCKIKRKRPDSVLWQKPLHQQKCQKGKMTA